MSQNKNLGFNFVWTIPILLTLIFVTTSLSSPLGITDKSRSCSHKMKELFHQSCKILRSRDALIPKKNDPSEESESAYYESSSEEGSIHESREKRSVGSTATNSHLLLIKCCTIGCTQTDISKYCMMDEFSASSSPLPTTTAAAITRKTVVPESESQESNDSTEEEYSQIEVETSTASTSDDLIIVKNNHD